MHRVRPLRRSVLLAVAFVLLGHGFAARSAPLTGGQAASPVRWRGLALTFTVPRRQYPANALIRVTLAVRNVTRHTIYLFDGLNGLDAFVLDDAGTQVYDQRNPLGTQSYAVPPGGPPRYGYPLYPGRLLRRHLYLVLRGDRVSYSVELGGPANQAGPTLQGVPVRVALTAEPAPHVVIVRSPSLHAVVTPAGSVAGPLYLAAQAACISPGGGLALTSRGWSAVGGSVVVPGSTAIPGVAGCPRLVWRGLVAWLNHPVAAIDDEEDNVTGYPAAISSPTQ